MFLQLKSKVWHSVCVASILTGLPLVAATTQSLPTMPQGQSVTTPAAPATPAQPQKQEVAPPPFVPLQKPVLPPMTKPFGMPGVVGLQNNQWAGTDYLGYLSNHITVDVEILKGQDVPAVPEAAVLENRVKTLLTKEDITPQSEQIEGPPLPFLHILLIIYPAEKDRFVIFGASRLFEQVQVMRKNFRPAGYWQAITWESQDVRLASTEQLNAEVISLVDALATAFAKRFKQYHQPADHPTAE